MWTAAKLILLASLAVAGLAVSSTLAEEDVPSESKCRPYIEKALKELESDDTERDSTENNDSIELSNVDNTNGKELDENSSNEVIEKDDALVEEDNDRYVDQTENDDDESKEIANDSKEDNGDNTSKEDGASNEDDDKENDDDSKNDDGDSGNDDSKEAAPAADTESEENDEEGEKLADTSDEAEKEKLEDTVEDGDDSKQDDDDNKEDSSNENAESADSAETVDHGDYLNKMVAEDDESSEKANDDVSQDDGNENDSNNSKEIEDDSKQDTANDEDNGTEKTDNDDENTKEDDSEEVPEEAESAMEIPKNLRSREYITQILRLMEEAGEDELVVERSADITLRELKRLYENSIKPLEGLYKYRDLSNRHFGDPEIFSKPLVLFMGPWSSGKSSIVNYLTGIEFSKWKLRTGAEPSPAYFNILMHGKEPEVLDGTQLAADWTFSGLQKFGQGLEERLRGLKHPSKILEKMNIVEIPGIIEVRKQVSRAFPFNDACQWFIDRADIIFFVYDPSKLDVGPETEAILDQLKGRESQTRIVLNKADSVKPEELMRVQSALIWNISPLMSSAQPPLIYTVSLRSLPYAEGAPKRFLQAQERELLKDIRNAVDRRIENKIASARRFAVRVRNHAKMVDCYLTTYYNHKTIFGNKKLISAAIIENPQNYHIYEGLSTLTNISRYDLPDPETYRYFFRLNPLYEFQPLSATCTYFRGCPITRLDVAIAYDLPDLVGKYKKMVETAIPQSMPKS